MQRRALSELALNAILGSPTGHVRPARPGDFMNRRDLFLFLGLQILAIAIAGLSFKIFESRLLAGAVAGGYFVLSGLFMVWRASHWADKWRSTAWYPLLTHVFLISIPMVISRFLQATQDFEEVRIFGLAGPQFHRLSTTIFMILVAGTTIDLIRIWWRTREGVRLNQNS